MAPEQSLGKILAEAAERHGYKVEWYSGKIVMQTSASAFHNLIVFDIMRQLPAERWWGLPDMTVGTRETIAGRSPTS